MAAAMIVVLFGAPGKTGQAFVRAGGALGLAICASFRAADAERSAL